MLEEIFDFSSFEDNIEISYAIRGLIRSERSAIKT